MASIDRLREAEGIKMHNLSLTTNSASPKVENAPRSSPAAPEEAPEMTPQPAEAAPAVTASFDELAMMVRHGKYKTLKKALEPLPDRDFDPSTVKKQYLPEAGTVYDDATQRLVFHINMCDDKGNSLMTLAAQNNSIKGAELLLKKGANINHQNVRCS